MSNRTFSNNNKSKEQPLDDIMSSNGQMESSGGNLLRQRRKIIEVDDELVRQSATEDTPRLCSETCSVDSGSLEPPHKSLLFWRKPYQPPPVVHQSTILFIGAFIFVLAMIWPPLILFFFYVLSKLIPYSWRINDSASKRRKLFAEFSKIEDLPERFRKVPKGIIMQEAYWANQRGMALNSSIMIPRNQEIKAVVCFCHGYTDCSSFVMRMQNQRLVEQGIAVVAIEYEGHGRSDGPLGLISDWNVLVDDVSSYFQQVLAQEQFAGKTAFLMGESMGGAVSYCIYNKMPHLFRGVVFVCPMCKISDDMLPPQFVIDLLLRIIGPTGTTSLLGYLPIAPSGHDLGNLAYKVLDKRDLACCVPTHYGRNPRLATARELIQASRNISSSLSTFTAPFLVVHGKADRVTDPRLSEQLYKESSSTDKAIKLYDDMWHCMLGGETDENVEIVYNDIISWVLERA